MISLLLPLVGTRTPPAAGEVLTEEGVGEAAAAVSHGGWWNSCLVGDRDADELDKEDKELQPLDVELFLACLQRRSPKQSDISDYLINT